MFPPLLDWVIPVYTAAELPLHRGHLLRWAFIRTLARRDPPKKGDTIFWPTVDGELKNMSTVAGAEEILEGYLEDDLDEFPSSRHDSYEIGRIIETGVPAEVSAMFAPETSGASDYYAENDNASPSS